LEGLQTGKASGRTFQNLTYQYDKVGNILGQANLATVNVPNQMGGATQFSYQYDDLYQLVGAQGAFQEARQQHRYELSMQYDSVHNIVAKKQLAEWSPNAGEKWLPQKKVSYDFAYDYKGSQPHAPSHIGEQAFSYDANGNQTGWTHDQNGTRRQVVWDEENRIQSVFENGHEITFKYDAAGQRVIKRGTHGETAYVNQFFVIRNGAVATKQVYAGSSRLVSKVVKQEKAGIDGQNGNGKPKGSAKGVLEKQVYFYHPDHLGSTSYVTDAKGDVYQHVEYFPFGESWVEQVRNAQQVAFGFTGKELDAETGLYYFGARYYDARTSVWVSPDPILGAYLGGKAGMGGVFNSFNLGLYSYGHLNPVKFVDPDGNRVVVKGKATQNIVLAYLRDQFGTDIFKFNGRGNLKVDKKAYNLVKNNFNPEQKDMFAGLKEITGGGREIDIYINKNAGDNTYFKDYTVYNKDANGAYVPEEVSDKYTVTGTEGAFGVHKPTGTGLITMNDADSSKGQFNTGKNTKTNPCASCVFIHELLDHGLTYFRTGKNPAGTVDYHNKALINKGSLPRYGTDH
jgi:RHS repeat-associated protein